MCAARPPACCCCCSPDGDVLAARVLSHTHASTSKPGAGTAASLARSSSVPQPSPRKQQQQQAEAAPDPSLATARLGAEAALRAVCVRFGAAVFEQLPSLWQHMAAALEAQPGLDGAPGGDPQALIHAIQVSAKLAGSCRSTVRASGQGRLCFVLVWGRQQPSQAWIRYGLGDNQLHAHTPSRTRSSSGIKHVASLFDTQATVCSCRCVGRRSRKLVISLGKSPIQLIQMWGK